MTKSVLNLKSLAAACFVATLLPLQALAVGSDTSEPPKKTKTTTECKNGQVWDEKTQKCVDPKKSELDDDTLYKAARELAYDGQYEHSLTVLAQMKNQDEPRVLNYKGYDNRKAGRFDVGMNYYNQALAKDPNFILARSYMGQAYVEDGQLLKAKVQLDEIGKRGGKGTWAYRALEEALFEGASYR